MIIEYFKSLYGSYTILIFIGFCIFIMFCIFYKIKRQLFFLISAVCVGVMIVLTVSSFYITWNVKHGNESLRNRDYQNAVKYLSRLELFANYSKYLNYIPGFFVPKRETIARSLGTSYHEINNYKKAVYYLRNSLLISPDDFISRVYLAHAYYFSGETQKAYEEYKYVTTHQYEEKDFLYFFNLGKSYGNLKMYEKAVIAFLKALELLPDRNGVHIYIAGCYSMKNERIKALEHLKHLKIKDAEYIDSITKDRFFDAIKNTAEFKEILIQMRKEGKSADSV